MSRLRIPRGESHRATAKHGHSHSKRGISRRPAPTFESGGAVPRSAKADAARASDAHRALVAVSSQVHDVVETRASRPLPRTPREFDRVLREFADLGLGWEDILAAWPTREAAMAWVAHRERLVLGILAELLAEQGGRVAVEATGSTSVFPPSDLDVSVYAIREGASPAKVIGGFYDRFRERYRAEPGFLLDANVLDQIPAFARRGEAWSPVVEELHRIPHVTEFVESWGVAAAMATAIQYLGVEEISSLLEQLGPTRKWSRQTWSRASRTLHEDFEIAKILADRAGRAEEKALKRLQAESPHASMENLRQRACNELYVQALQQVQALYERQEATLAQLDTPDLSIRHRRRICREVLELEEKIVKQHAIARTFLDEAYTSPGAIAVVVGGAQGLNERVGHPLPETVRAHFLQSLFEHLGEVAKVVRQKSDQPFLEVARSSSKYLERLLGAAMMLCDRGTAAHDRMVRAHALSLQLRSFRRDPGFETDPQKQAQARELVEEGLGVATEQEYLAYVKRLVVEVLQSWAASEQAAS